MAAPNLFEMFSYFISDKEEKYLTEKANDYLVFFGNNKPNKLQQRVMKSLLDGIFIKHSLLFDNRLTLQEIKCLTLASQGKNMEESATVLGLSLNSIKYYRKSLIKKLGCRNMIEASLVGLRYGLIFKSKEI